MAKTKEKSSTPQIQYGLKSIQVNRFNYTIPKIKVNNIESVPLNYNITPNIKYNLKESLILVFIETEIVIKETSERTVDSEFVFVFAINDLQSFIQQNEKTQIWSFKDQKNEGLITTLIGISLSTTRGMLLEKTRGTIAEGAPLPIMNPATFVHKAE